MKYYKVGFFIFIFFFFQVNEKVIASDISLNQERVSNESKVICENVKNIPIFSKYIFEYNEINEFKKCDSLSLYYGFKDSPDYINARKCAWIQKDYDILAMLYANGQGVEKNLDIALHYACMINGAAAENDGRIQHLIKIKEKNKLSENFDICDDITSGHMMALCASIAQRLEEKENEKKMAKLKLNWSKHDSELFSKLKNASIIYFNARTNNEIDMRGTAGSAYVIAEQMALNERMIKDILKVDRCNPFLYTSKDFQKSDKNLNAIYKKFFTKYNIKDSFYSLKGIRDTQRAWIKYRDTWVDFGKSRCPQIKAETWMTLITNERIQELKKLAEDIEA